LQKQKEKETLIKCYKFLCGKNTFLNPFHSTKEDCQDNSNNNETIFSIPTKHFVDKKNLKNDMKEDSTTLKIPHDMLKKRIEVNEMDKKLSEENFQCEERPRDYLNMIKFNKNHIINEELDNSSNGLLSRITVNEDRVKSNLFNNQILKSQLTNNSTQN